jgi:hypothetical protein
MIPARAWLDDPRVPRARCDDDFEACITHLRPPVTHRRSTSTTNLIERLCDQLQGELKEVNSVDAAAVWARRILPAKNSLNVADARQLENAFPARLAELELGAGNTEPPPSPFGSIRNHATALERKRPERTETSATERIEKVILRIRDESAIESM